jgi:hypothetical protein
MEKRQVWIPALALAGAVAAGPVLGQEWTRDWYFGANAGQSDPDEGGIDDATGWKAYAGYKFNPFLGVQLGYVNLGEFDIDAVDDELEVTGWDVTAVGSWPIPPNPNVVLFGKVGAFAWEADTSTLGDDDGTDLTFGLGAMYRMPNNIGLRAEWDRYQDVGETDVDMLSAGLSFGF